MPEIIEIVEILGRSEQGATRPFRCKAANGKMYSVKGYSASTRSLVCEWIAAYLGHAFGLALPNFCIAEIPADLVFTHPEGKDLGEGQAFASELIPSITELTHIAITDVPVHQRQDVLIFDWWIRNGDRTLTKHGGNPNLLWSAINQQLVVIDHNLAFDDALLPKEFCELHVFRREIATLKADVGLQRSYFQRLEHALTCWNKALEAMPQQWMYHDDERTIPTNFDIAQQRNNLERYRHPEFWKFF